jgi:hypothetical protein
MNDQNDQESHPIDALVGRYLERQAKQQNTTALRRKILANLAGDQSSVHTTPARARSSPSMWLARRVRPLLWVSAAAAAIMVAFWLGQNDSLSRVSAAELVRGAQETHAGPVERCYTVVVQRDDPNLGEYSPRDVRIWTQGDRFWMEMNRPNGRWAWGREARGSVWLALGPRRAVRIEAEEMGDTLRSICDLYSLELETLLGDALRHCRLEWTESDALTHVLTARPRGWVRGGLQQAVLEVDKETKAIRRLVIERRFARRGASTVTFTLVEARTPDESKYQAEGHLTAPFRIFTRDSNPERRSEALATWFGGPVDRWIRPANASAPSDRQ